MDRFSFTADAKSFLASVEAVGLAVDARSHIEVLRNILIDFDDDGFLRLMGTDHRVFIRKCIPEIEVDGSRFGITVPLTILKNALKGKKGEVEIEATRDDDSLSFRIGNFTFRGSDSVIDAEDFPPFPVIDPEKKSENLGFAIDKKTLEAALSRVVKATDVNDARQFANGVLFSKNAFVATDGHRLAIVTPFDPPIPEGFDTIVATETISKLLRVLKKSREDEVYVVKAANSTGSFRINFYFDDYEIVSGVIDTEYPKYGRANPDYYTSDAWFMTFDREEMVSAIKEAIPFVKRGKNKAMSFIFDKHSKKIKIEASREASGSYAEDVGADYEGKIKKQKGPLRILFNALYIRDMLDLPKECEIVTWQIREKNKVLKMVVQYDDVEETHVLMVIPS